jgi:Fic family protein
LYIYESPQWPNLKWNTNLLSDQLATVRHQQGRLIGRMEALGFKLREEACFDALTKDALTTSEIEGQLLAPEQVRSSLARRLGIETAAFVSADREVDGVVDMLLDATQKYASPLTKERLFGWHSALFPTGWSGMFQIKVGRLRDDTTGPMQVVSGSFGRERIHFQAPAAESLNQEMDKFLDWFENNKELDPVLKSGVAHLWFITLHPFDDGNGRIARAIADLALARSEQTHRRFYSMSAQIAIDRKAYYSMLEQTQKGTVDITAWLQWYLACLERAIQGAQSIQASVLRKAQFWDSIAPISINERQNKILNKMLTDFRGKLNTSKWAKLAKCSQDTALRDILYLVEQGVLKKDTAGGRSTSYFLSIDAGTESSDS